MKLYKNAIESNDYNLTLCETQREYSKLVVDIDLKSVHIADTKTRLYTNELVEIIAKKYMKSIKHHLHITDNEKLNCLLFEKPKPNIVKNIKKDGFHLLFPKIITDKKTRQLIRQYVVESIDESIFEDEACCGKFSETLKTYSPNNIIDDVTSKNWLLPGSGKPEGGVYNLTNAYNNKMEPLDVEISTNDLFKLTSLYNINEDKALEIKEITPHSRAARCFADLPNGPASTTPPPPPSPAQSTDNNNNNNKSKISNEGLKFIYDNLKTSRWDNYNDWITIYMILINENLDFDIFDEASKKSTKYDASNNAKKLRQIKIKKTGYTEKTLFKMLKDDNPEAHKEYLIKFGGLQMTEINQARTYESIKEKFEKSHFKIKRPIMFGEILTDGTLYLRSESDLITVYKNLMFEYINPKTLSITTAPFIGRWLQDETMRTYEKIDFLPMQEAPPNIYNTFTGYEAAKLPVIEGVNVEESLIFKHIQNLCDNNEHMFKYFINFLSRKLRQPYNLTNTAIIFKSEQGAGKDLFLNWFGNNILGSNYYYSTEKPELIFGKFNGVIENKILIVLNETSGKDTFQIIENIKALITNEYNVIENKGLKPFNNTNNIGIVFPTNNNNPINIPYDDRRFTGTECNNNICNNNEYFTLLIAEMKSRKYNRAFYDYLMNLDTDNYDFTNNRPNTSYYNDLRELNIGILPRFCQSLVNKKITESSPTALYNLFNSFVEFNKSKIEYTPTRFGVEIKKFTGINQEKSNGRKYKINIDEMKQYLITKYRMEFYDDEFIDDEEQYNKSKHCSKIPKKPSKLNDELFTIKKSNVNLEQEDDELDYDSPVEAYKRNYNEADEEIY